MKVKAVDLEAGLIPAQGAVTQVVATPAVALVLVAYLDPTLRDRQIWM